MEILSCVPTSCRMQNMWLVYDDDCQFQINFGNHFFGYIRSSYEYITHYQSQDSQACQMVVLVLLIISTIELRMTNTIMSS